MKLTSIAKNERGIALLLTLTMLAIVLILMIAFVTSMRTERIVAKNFNDLAKARLLAGGAVDRAVAILQLATPLQQETPAPQSFWTAPGFALSYTNGAFTNVALYSTNNLASDWVNLNDKQQITGINSLIPAGNSAMYAGWVNVDADGKDPAVSGKPIIGRFAFWVDDEATKVNPNMAWKRDTAGGGLTSTNNSLPGEIDLRALEPPFSDSTPVADAVSISTHGANPPFNTPQEIKTTTGIGNPQLAYVANQFCITTFSTDTNVDTWGRARIDLNSITDPTPTGDAYKRLDEDIYRKIYPFLNPGSDRFSKKYGPGNVQQILANIIDYRQLAATPATYDALDPTLEIPLTYCGLKKGPLLNEVILHTIALNASLASMIITTNAGPVYLTNWNVTVRAFLDVELMNPFRDARGSGYQVFVEPDPANPITFQLYPGTTNGATAINTGLYPVSLGAPLPVQTLTANSATLTVPADIPGYSYWSLSATNVSGSTPAANWQFVPHWDSAVINYTKQTADPLEVPGVTNIQFNIRRVLLRQSTNKESIRDWATTADFAPQPITINRAIVWTASLGNNGAVTDFLGFDPNSANGDKEAKGIAKNDPRIRTFTSNPPLGTTKSWYPTFYNTSGQTRPTPNTQNAGGIFEHKTQVFVPTLLPDGTERQSVPNAISGMASTFYIKEAPFESPGELGFIHTGVPWKTLRIQSVVPPINSVIASTGAFPLPSEAGSIPDWVLLDIFTAGMPPVVHGRLNINSSIFGSNNFDRTFPPPRTPSMAALFYGMTNTSLSYPISTGSPPVIIATNFWCGTTTFNASAMTQLSPQPSSQGVLPDTNAMNIAWSHDTNLTQAIRDQYFAPNTTPYRLSPLFLTPGEICEVKGIDNALIGWGSPLQGPRKADKELIPRKIANLITTRSNTFTVWADGQVIIDVDKDGKYTGGTDVISGEARVQAVIERYVDGGVVKFRTRYFRFIYD